MSLNKVMLIGHLGGDAETRMAGESKVAAFSVATTERWKDKNGDAQEATEWPRCEFWNPCGVLPYLVKGQQVFVEGTLRTEKYKDKDGVDKVVVKVRVLSLQLIGGRDGQQEGDAPHRAQRQPVYSGPAPRVASAPAPVPATGSGNPEDDLPF